jgi:hypothetical protein
LSHYLQHWESWQAEEYRRQAREIRFRAETETRPWVITEMLEQAKAYERAAFLDGVISKTLKELERKARAKPLNRGQIKLLRLLASRGVAKAKKLLDRENGAEKSKNNLPLQSSRAAKSFRSQMGVGGNSAKTRPHIQIKIIRAEQAK